MMRYIRFILTSLCRDIAREESGNGKIKPGAGRVFSLRLRLSNRT